MDALRAGLRDLGYVEGDNLSIDFRWAEGRYDRLPALAAELVRLKVDVIVTATTPATLAAKQATTTIPIVMAATGDAVADGLVDRLNRPGGNVTGSSFSGATAYLIVKYRVCCASQQKFAPDGGSGSLALSTCFPLLLLDDRAQRPRGVSRLGA